LAATVAAGAAVGLAGAAVDGVFWGAAPGVAVGAVAEAGEVGLAAG